VCSSDLVALNAPTIFLGLAKKDGTFIVQTSFPIIPSINQVQP
jgi:hypothetical protein